MLRRPPRLFTHHACTFTFVFLMFITLARAAPQKTSAGQPETVIAIGDVHGDFDDFVSVLLRTGLVDSQHHWSGKNATFVQVGDLLDRGPKPRDVMDLMMSLEQEAPKSGGRVVSLLGNH